MADLDELRQQVADKQHELRAAFAALFDATGVFIIPHAPEIADEKLFNCRVLRNRYEVIKRMPKNGVVAEIGTQTGLFAKYINDVSSPSQLHVVDIDYSTFKDELFVGVPNLHKHLGRSDDILNSFEDNHFDWIYIDASHAYEYVSKDILISSSKVKPGGYIICNDYTVWSPAEVEPYGVLFAVNEFCQAHDWEFLFFALGAQGFHDVCLRKGLG